jgi:NAD(P)H-dependent FMN reductase
MKFAIINGSTRPNAQSLKVSQYIEHVLSHLNDLQAAHLISLTDNPIPHWDESLWQDKAQWPASWQKISDILQTVDGVVVVSPEWGGMVPPALKNFFQMATHGELRHKPGLIVAVSASMGGAYPVAELRMSSYKNTHFCYIPEHVIIRNINNLLNDWHTPANEDDIYIRGRLHYALETLAIYATAFQGIRAATLDKGKEYPYGM